MSNILIIADNRKAWHDYEILKTIEAGVVLVGSEVKALRAKQLQLKDAYVVMKSGEAFLQNAHIAEYKMANINNHIPERPRKLLLNRKELIDVEEAVTEKGLSVVATKAYFKNGRVKIEIAIARGKKAHDKRESIKKRDVDAQLRKTMQRSGKGASRSRKDDY